MGAPLAGGRGIVAASSGLNVGGPPNEGFSRPIELSAAPVDTHDVLDCTSTLQYTALLSIALHWIVGSSVGGYIGRTDAGHCIVRCLSMGVRGIKSFKSKVLYSPEASLKCQVRNEYFL